MAIRLILLLLFCAVAQAQVDQYPPIPQQGGAINICNQGVICNADTLWVNESISCSGSPAVITGMVDTLSLSPYGDGKAYATVTGCGPASAINVVQTGVTVAGGGSGYAASVAPVAGDYIVISGGTPVSSSQYTGTIDHTTGILTVTAWTSGPPIVPGQVLTWSGQGATNITFIQDFISGTGGVGTYLTTYNNGSDLGSTAFTGTDNTVIRVLTVSGGAVVTAGVVAGGQYTSPPAANQGQGSTSGSGVGATFTLTYIGLPISGKVAKVSAHGFTFVTGVNSVTTVSSTQEQISIGHPDDTAVSTALTKNPVAVFFPNTTQPAWSRIPLGYGFLNQINLPITQRISVLCQGTRIIALGSMNAQMAVAFQSNTSLFYKPILDNCDFQGMGVANYNVYESSAQWQIQNSSLENATVENLFIGDSSNDNANDVVVSNVRIHTDTNAVPSWPLYNYEISKSADGKVIGSTMDHAIWGGMLINGADEQVTATHLFAYGAGPCYDIESAKDGIDGICDNQAPGQAGWYMNGSLGQIKDGWMDSVASGTLLGRYGVYINNDSRNTIGCGVGDTGSVWNGNTSNLVFFGVTQTLTRVAPCTGNGASDPTIIEGPTTVNGQLSIVPANGSGGAAIQNTNTSPAAASDLNASLNAKSAAPGSNLAGGNAVLNAGNGDSTAGDNQAGGNANINGGNGFGTGAGGGINIVSGNGGASGQSGTVIIKASTSGSSQGPVTIANAASGAVNILTGASSGVTHINDGTGTGNIQIGNSSSPLTNLGSAQVNLNGTLLGLNSVKAGECGTAPTIGAGFGSTASFIPAFNCSEAFSITASGSSQTTTTALTGFPSVANKWVCLAIDETTNITSRETGHSATSVTMTWSSAPTANDVLDFFCWAI